MYAGKRCCKRFTSANYVEGETIEVYSARRTLTKVLSCKKKAEAETEKETKSNTLCAIV